jgi:hypothetical protein
MVVDAMPCHVPCDAMRYAMPFDVIWSCGAAQ